MTDLPAKRARSAAPKEPAEDAPPLRVFTLGRFRVFRGDEEITEAGWKRKKDLKDVKRLFKCLISLPGDERLKERLELRKTVAQRDRVAEWLWPYLGPTGAGTGSMEKLSDMLYYLRDVLQPGATAKNSHYLPRDFSDAIVLQNIGWIDADAFETRATRCAKEGAGLDELEACLNLYEGPYLPDDYDEWAIARRSQLLRLYTLVATQLAEACLQAGDYRRPMKLLQQAVQAEPEWPTEWEEAYRTLMLLWARLEKPIEATRCYEDCCQALTTYHNAAPMPETARLHEEILAGRHGPPRPFHVPYPRNALYTGRTDVLARIHAAFQAGDVTAYAPPQAVSGLGGMGKTQTALEYAYAHRDHYEAVLWAGADSPEALTAHFVVIATQLNLPERHEHNQSLAVGAVKRWLSQHHGWLLILDNVEDLRAITDFLPPDGQGHVLITTRAQALGGLVQSVALDQMEAYEAATFLLRRAGVAGSSDEHWALAREICLLLGGLPLALDQAGAYIEETGCGLAEYLHLYRTRQAHLLRERGDLAHGHPESVTTTWSLSFRKVEQANPAAAELLRFCAHLHPDAIPEEIITNGAAELGSILAPVAADQIALNQVIKELRRYSLIRRSGGTRLLSIHRLVQAVLRDEMDEAGQQIWAERTVKAVNHAFPEDRFETWPQCERCLPHAQSCVTLIEQWRMETEEAASLLNRAGFYLRQRGQYREAAALCERGLVILERLLGPDDIEVGETYNKLGAIYYGQGRYADAEAVCRRELAIRQHVLGPDHADVAESLNNLAVLCRSQGRYAEAETLYWQALELKERVLGPTHPHVAVSLNGIAKVFDEQGRHAEAETFCRRALAIREQVLEPGHPDIAHSLIVLARLCQVLGKDAEAETLSRRALAIREQALGAEHPYVAVSLNTLGDLYVAQGRYDEAEPLLQRALTIRLHALGEFHPDVAQSLYSLARFYHARGRYSEAEPYYQRALTLREQSFPPNHPDVNTTLKHYTTLLRLLNRDSDLQALEARVNAAKP